MRPFVLIGAFLAQGLLAARLPDPANLERVALVASVMLDGDVCERIQTARSLQFLLHPDPRDAWRAGDNYEVNDAAFTQTKKTLIRLAQLCETACDVNLWMPVSGKPTRVQVVIRNVHEMSQFWRWGEIDQDLAPEMKQVLQSAKPLLVRNKPGIASVLTPVFNSLGDVVAVAEVVSQENEDPRENVK